MHSRTAGWARRSIDGRFLLILGLFFASGMAGLIYQVVWSRLLTLVIGVSIFAITAVICTFMGGLALGSYVIGRRAELWGQPLRVYGVLEALIGIYALLTPWIFEALQPVYASGFSVLDGVGLNAFRIVLSALVLLLPTALMGGTLPLLSRTIAAHDDRAARRVGLLYAVNTFGAVAGCLAAGFVLLAVVGIRGSLYITAAVNFAVATIAILASRGSSPVLSADAVPSSAAAPSDAQGRFVLVLFFLSGFAALGYEVLWTRALLVHLKSSTYAFSLMLSVYLFGVATGSMAVSGLASRSRRPLRGLALCQLGVVATVVAGLMVFPDIGKLGLALIGSKRIDGFGRAVALMFAQASMVLLLPTLFMGAMFPFGLAAYHQSQRGVGRSVGTLYAVNTAGNIAGSILVGFAAITLIGVRHSIVAMLAINLALAATILARLAPTRLLRVIWPAAAAGILAIIHLSVSDQLFYQSLTSAPGARIIFYREGASDTVAVVEQQVPVKRRTLIYSDGRGAAGTSTLVWNLYFAHLPMILHADPQEVLHICYGSGNSVLGLTRHDPERIDVIELSPHVRDASDYFWTNEGVIHHPNVNLIIEDGRNFLLGTNRSYDVVSLEPPNIFTAGVVNLYTVEFYEIVRQHLNPGGIFVQWLPTGQLSDADRGHMIRALTEAFPYVYTWQQLIGPTLLLMGTLEPLSVDVDEVDRRLKADEMKRDIAAMGTRSAERFLSFFLLGNESTRKLAAGYEAVRDDRTIVDYSIPRFVGSGFGLSRYTYAIGSKDHNPWSVGRARIREYAEWADPASTIIPDREQAKRVEKAILLRRLQGRRQGASR